MLAIKEEHMIFSMSINDFERFLTDPYYTEKMKTIKQREIKKYQEEKKRKGKGAEEYLFEDSRMKMNIPLRF